MRHNPNETPVIPDPVPPAPQDENVDQAAARLGLTAPRVTLEALNAAIIDVEFVRHVAKSGQVLRWAVLTLRNGFAHAGDPSASVSAANDSQELGERYALENARRSLWPLLGYALKEQLHIEAAVNSASTDRDALARGGVVDLSHGNTVAGFIGWLSPDIPELRTVEVPRLAASYDRFLARLDEERASGEGMPQRSSAFDAMTSAEHEAAGHRYDGRLDTWVEMTDAQHGAAGHVYHAESGRWLVPPPTKAGDTVRIGKPRTQE